LGTSLEVPDAQSGLDLGAEWPPVSLGDNPEQYLAAGVRHLVEHAVTSLS
jgi:hypothetical protein